jgi:L-glyceraldehyde 3-phosphate reductase
MERKMSFNEKRYDSMQYRRCGRSGLSLPVISLGGWQAIGSYRDDDTSKALFFAAFDRGITHFDFANNYGRPGGASEELFGHILKEMPRNELVISTKAGNRMWPGPYGDGGGRKYILESCDESLRRLGVDHVDIFYSHRFDGSVPMEETLRALEDILHLGKALYIGISNYYGEQFQKAVDIMRQHDWHPITINQPYYNMLGRGAEDTVLPVADREGVGVIAFCPLAQGLLAGRYLEGMPQDSRASVPGMGDWLRKTLDEASLKKARELNEIAKSRGESLARMTLAWTLRDKRVTSLLIGASKVEQIVENVKCLQSAPFGEAELKAIEAVLKG